MYLLELSLAGDLQSSDNWFTCSLLRSMLRDKVGNNMVLIIVTLSPIVSNINQTSRNMQTSLGITTQAKHDRMEMNMIHLNVFNTFE